MAAECPLKDGVLVLAAGFTVCQKTAVVPKLRTFPAFWPKCNLIILSKVIRLLKFNLITFETVLSDYFERR